MAECNCPWVVPSEILAKHVFLIPPDERRARGWRQGHLIQPPCIAGMSSSGNPVLQGGVSRMDPVQG